MNPACSNPVSSWDAVSHNETGALNQIDASPVRPVPALHLLRLK